MLLFVIPIGFEPMTYRLEICCSIQLSYGTIILGANMRKSDLKSKYNM
jgi:hypothetical protein